MKDYKLQKSQIVVNALCSILFLACSVMYLDQGNRDLALLFGIAGLIWVFSFYRNVSHYKKALNLLEEQ